MMDINYYFYILVIFTIYLFSGLDAKFEDHQQVSQNELADLEKFFSSTYIEKVKANKENGNTAYCFKEGWQLFHFHHVCTRGGQDGIVVGLGNVSNDWSHLATEKNLDNIFSADDWDHVVSPGSMAGKRHPMAAHRINPHEIEKIAVIPGPTLFQNCFEQELDSYNPAHWMMKLGTLFELGNCLKETTQKGGNENNFANQKIKCASCEFLSNAIFLSFLCMQIERVCLERLGPFPIIPSICTNVRTQTLQSGAGAKLCTKS